MYDSKLFHILMALYWERKEFLYASIIVGSCKNLNEWRLVTLLTRTSLAWIILLTILYSMQNGVKVFVPDLQDVLMVIL